MDVCVIGAGLMGKAICHDLLSTGKVRSVVLVDVDKNALQSVKQMAGLNDIVVKKIDVTDQKMMKPLFKDCTVAISAIPYFFNDQLTRLAIDTQTHFIDLGGNNTVVSKQKTYYQQAVDAQVTVIPDNGLAPGLVSVITRDIVDEYEDVEDVYIRVGGLPIHPQPPLNYEIVFSPNGLINEYMEEAVILDHGEIHQRPSMTEIEQIRFPEPFGMMEAFITSGGCSTLPYTFQTSIGYLDYKTIRYPGHCEQFKTILNLGFGSTSPQSIHGVDVVPRDVLINQLKKVLPKTGDDVVLLKVFSHAKKNKERYLAEYTMIDYKDEKTSLTAMMRTTGFPVSITATFLLNGNIQRPGVFCPEEIIPPKEMFSELRKRNININKTEEKDVG
jgi:lysine 6-dehydrogenase